MIQTILLSKCCNKPVKVERGCVSEGIKSMKCFNCKINEAQGTLCPQCLSGAVKASAQMLGKLGGSIKSEAKAKAAQVNGKKGGRPPTPSQGGKESI